MSTKKNIKKKVDHKTEKLHFSESIDLIKDTAKAAE